MQIERITTAGYNAYLVKGERTALIDSAPYADELLKRLDVKKIDYFIFTHTDRARAGAVDDLTALDPDAEVIASIAGLRNIKEIVNRPVKERAAKDGMVIDLGGVSLEVLITPNLNWPDTMMLYSKETKTLFSGTLFVDKDGYYERELALYPDFAKTAVERAAELDIKSICPSEGEMPDISITDKYMSFVSPKEKEKGDTKCAAVIYAGHESGYTAKMAHTAADALCEQGYAVHAVNCLDSIDLAVEEMNAADVLVFASPTIHRNAVPEIMDVISRIDRVNKVRTPAMVIGSYGWGGEALGFMYGYLKMLKMRVFEKPFGVIMKPSETELNELKKYTARFSAFAEEIYDNK